MDDHATTVCDWRDDVIANLEAQTVQCIVSNFAQLYMLDFGGVQLHFLLAVLEDPSLEATPHQILTAAAS